jgi:hypothetical protein
MTKTLAITTNVGCKNLCKYCPQEKFLEIYLKRSKIVMMSFNTFKKCIDKLPESVSTINFGGFSEPWLNPECTKMLLYAHKKKFKINVFTTGIEMKIADIDKIKHIEFVSFNVHLPNNNEFANNTVSEENLSIINKIIKSNIYNILFKFHQYSSDEEKLHPKIKPLMKKFNIICENTRLFSRVGSITFPNKPKFKKIQGKILRCYRVDINILFPNGDVILCCMDWEFKHILGNLLETDYQDIINGNEFKKIIRGLNDDSIYSICRYCEITKKKGIISYFKDIINFLIN